MSRLHYCLAISLLLAAVPASADVRNDPVKIRRVGALPVLVPGEPEFLHLELAAARDVTVGGIVASSRSLTRLSAAPAGMQQLTSGATLPITLELLPDESPEPVVIRYEADGETFEQTIDIRPLLASERAKRSKVNTAPDTSPRPPAPRFQPAPAEPPSYEDDPELEPMPSRGPSSPQSSDRDIRVRGRFVGYRSDGVMIGADQIWVRVMDEDTGPDDVLASFHADQFGYFDVTFYWSPLWTAEGEPDLYVKFEAEHSFVTVQSAGLELDYAWQTDTHNGYSGSDLNLGTIWPSDSDTWGAIQIFTDIQRDYTWYFGTAGYLVPHVDVQWPDGDTGAYYSTYWEEIHVGWDRTWREDTHAHELGHHFINNFAASENFDYCNGICDTGSCGHCLWCEESPHIAFNEGWPNWIGHVQSSSYATDYGMAAQFTRDQESIQTCDASGFDDPLKTEGFIGAVLQDIWDSAQDTDPNGLGQMDALALGVDEIFYVLDTSHPTSPFAFMNAFKSHYPLATPGLWQTALNNRWQLDTQNPSPITGLGSTTHTPNVASTNPQIIITWNASTDDWSGIMGYDLVIDRPAPQPDTTFQLSSSPIAATYYLPGGSYTLLVRARDRQGRVSTYASTGPYIIQAPIPADLTWTQPSGWARPLVARPFNNSTPTSVPNPTGLSGEVNTTWLNFACINAGQQSYPTPPFPVSPYRIDGAIVSVLPSFTPLPGQVQTSLNAGPFTVRGGRHTVAMDIDYDNWWFEANETNNLWGHQWIWSTLRLETVATIRRAAPPHFTNGTNAVRDGSAVYYNCDGLNFIGNGSWNAVWIAADSDTSDYDLRLHNFSTGPDNGFAVPVGYSYRGPGCLDVVVVNRNTAGLATWDVGVTRSMADNATYVMGLKVASFDFLNYGDSVTVTLPDSAYVILKEVYFSSPTFGQNTVVVTGDPADGPFTLVWFDRTYVTGGLTSANNFAVSDATGLARINVNATVEGSYGVMVYRDPKDGRSSRDLVMELEPTPPDLKVFIPGRSGWSAAFVPRPAADGTPTSVPAPATLPGDLPSTFLNWYGENGSPRPAPAGVPVHVLRDGGILEALTTPALGAYASWIVNQSTPVTVPGGRHTLAMVYDPGQTCEELNESNNVWGEQYIWTPIEMTAGSPITRPAPPLLNGGWDQITTGETKLPNCDGLRVPVLSNGPAQWGGAALLPSSGEDANLHLYEIATGAKNGFTSALAISAANPGECEYILADFQATTRRPFDAGVFNVNEGVGDVVLEAESAERLGTSYGMLGSFTMAAGEIFALHEVVLAPGTYHMRLHNTGSIDLGLAYHVVGEPFQSKADAIMVEELNGPGADEEFDFVVTVGGACVFPVWRASAGDIATAGQYALEISAPVTGVAGNEPPAITQLTRMSPNPFHSAAGISFDLSSAEPVSLEIYDVRGTRVRTLTQDYMNAGRHEVTWSGDGDDGQELPAGLYFVSLETSTQRLTGRIVKVR